MENNAFIVTRLLKKDELIYEVVGRAAENISIGEQLHFKTSAGVSLFVVKELEAYRKKTDVLPRMYGGLITMELIDGIHPDFKEGDFLFIQSP
jgi:hypothetical protein